MSLGSGQTFEMEIKYNLQIAGLPSDVSKVIGRLYRFGCEHGSHHNILSGTILAIEVSDGGGLDLYVTNPCFWGQRLISIKYSNGKWMVRVDSEPRELSEEALERLSWEEHKRLIEEDIASRFFEGEFKLL